MHLAVGEVYEESGRSHPPSACNGESLHDCFRDDAREMSELDMFLYFLAHFSPLILNLLCYANLTQYLFFFSSLSIHLSTALLAHLFSYKDRSAITEGTFLFVLAAHWMPRT
ncbi:hypothetical protein K438DRAFT_1987443 [Mycena galopus ATCC 62051]|nr:hypothetical protein K438DRAFT_1987443 [Mycena galopus ATCC 62051]